MLIKDLSDQQKNMIMRYDCRYREHGCINCDFRIPENIIKTTAVRCLRLLLQNDYLCLKQQATIDIDIQTLEKLCQK
jgi:hypothetical protein